MDVAENEYFLVVGRFVSENNYEIAVRKFIYSYMKIFSLITNAELCNNLKIFYVGKQLLIRIYEINWLGPLWVQELLKYVCENTFFIFNGMSFVKQIWFIRGMATPKLNLLIDGDVNHEVAYGSVIYWIGQYVS